METIPSVRRLAAGLSSVEFPNVDLPAFRITDMQAAIGRMPRHPVHVIRHGGDAACSEHARPGQARIWRHWQVTNVGGLDIKGLELTATIVGREHPHIAWLNGNAGSGAPPQAVTSAL
jgi:hypothetical protein